MKLLEILKAQGLTDDQINAIQTSMKENKVYETSLENADERYNKLKTQKLELEEQIKIQGDTIKSFEGGFTKEQAEALVKENDAKIEAQALRFKQSKAMDKLFSEYEFSSENARIVALTQFEKAGLKFENDGWIGGKEFLDEMKKNDPKSFIEEAPGGSGFNPGGEPPQEKGDSAKQFMDAIFNNQLRK